MKRIIAVMMLVGVILFATAGCSAPGESSGSASGETETQETAAPGTEAETEQEAAVPETEAGTEQEAAVPETEAQTPEAAADGLVFETVDLEGNPVRSADLFSGSKLTMVNIWGTYCGPCIGEMPDLEVLNGRLGEKGCRIIGIVCDVFSPEDTGTIDEAKEIVEETGVTYLNILPWEGFENIYPLEFIPTTLFVNADGQIVGEAAVGSRGAEEYEALIDELLKTME